MPLFSAHPPLLDPLGEAVVEGGVEAIGSGSLMLQEDEIRGFVAISAARKPAPGR